MAILNILLVLNVKGFLETDSFSENLYMFDSTGYSNWTGQGEFLTTCNVGDTVRWTLASLWPASPQASINGFTGEMVNDGLLAPGFLHDNTFGCIIPQSVAGKTMTYNLAFAAGDQNFHVTATLKVNELPPHRKPDDGPWGG